MRAIALENYRLRYMRNPSLKKRLRWKLTKRREVSTSSINASGS